MALSFDGPQSTSHLKAKIQTLLCLIAALTARDRKSHSSRQEFWKLINGLFNTPEYKEWKAWSWLLCREGPVELEERRMKQEAPAAPLHPPGICSPGGDWKTALLCKCRQ